MGRKPLPEDEKKVRITIALPKWMVDKLRTIENYNDFIFKILNKYLK